MTDMMLVEYMDPNNDLPDVTYENNIEEKIDFTDPPTVDPIYLDWPNNG